MFGAGCGDTDRHAELLAKKTSLLRVFPDSDGKMNRSIVDIGGDALVVSNFTLYADCSHGNRPSFTKAMQPGEANRLYELYMAKLREYGIHVESGVFGADMSVTIENDGPVTIILETDNDGVKIV